MKKTLVAWFILAAFFINIQVVNADCPCQSNFCFFGNSSDCCFDPCCEDWLCPYKIEDYLCRIGLNECQKCEARKVIEQFKCRTHCNRAKNCKCETKGECRAYRNALRTLDCQMKLLITQCQKSDYRYVRKDVKNQVKCCHHCLINPFKR
jgi:hypothetical protein